MKNFLLNKKFIGAIAVFVYVICASIYFSQIMSDAIVQYSPVVAKEMEAFLPITIANGEIVEPKDTVIKRSYGNATDAFDVVLDTRVDEFDASSLKNQGLYVSRKYIYGVQKLKTEIRSLSELGDGTLDREKLNDFLQFLNANAGRYIFVISCGILLVFSICAILLYTIVMHWLMAMLFKIGFARTLRINSLAYVVISSLTLFTPIRISILLTLVIMIALNIGIDNVLKENQEA
ncbi:MAG: DUF1189 family protein [Alphaproteobacteria bacterium]|nr:DUF1189 family protein [Alphaproteobacteria bacterium]